MINIGFFTSPFQIINFFELLIKKKISYTNTLVYFVQPNNQNLKRIEYIKKFYNYFPTIIFIKKDINYFFFIFFLRNFFKKYNYIVIGRFFSPRLVSFLFLNAKCKYIVDDGVEDINIQKKLLYGKLNNLLYFIFKYRFEQVKFFTIFNKKKLLKIEKNNFFHLKKICNKIKFVKEIWFLDQPYFRDVYLNKNYYFNTIKKINKKFKDYKFKLILHPNDKNNKVKKVYRLNKIPFFKINKPLEIYFIKKKIVPRKIISFNSTLLVTMSILFSKFKVFKTIFVHPDKKNYTKNEFYWLNVSAYNYFIKLLNLEKFK